MSRVRSLLTCPFAAAWLLTGCGGGDLFLPEGDGSIAIQVVDGDGQRGSVGEPLDAPVVVEVTDEDGNPVEGVTVEFAFTSAGDGGEIAPPTARTSQIGRAQAHLLLGDKVGLQTGEARVLVQSGIEPITSFSALADAGDDGPAPPPPPPGNKAPQAEFQVDCDDLRCSFADGSTDEDGSIESRSWDFGDGSTSTERNPSHRYASPGQYSVVLVVTDDDGATDNRTRTASPHAPSEPPPPSNDPPRAEFESDCQELRCTFVDRSDDEDGSIVTWAWDFGDGTTSTDRNPSHSYAAGGTYQVLLLVTDDDGAADTRTHSVRAEDPAPPPPPPPPPPDPENERPKAEFRVECGGLTCVFLDESKDEDGSIVSWSWSFGDGATSTERNPTHTYASKGKYEVLLTVTDDQGAADTKERRVDPKD